MVFGLDFDRVDAVLVPGELEALSSRTDSTGWTWCRFGRFITSMGGVGGISIVDSVGDIASLCCGSAVIVYEAVPIHSVEWGNNAS